MRIIGIKYLGRRRWGRWVIRLGVRRRLRLGVGLRVDAWGVVGLARCPSVLVDWLLIIRLLTRAWRVRWVRLGVAPGSWRRLLRRACATEDILVGRMAFVRLTRAERSVHEEQEAKGSCGPKLGGQACLIQLDHLLAVSFFFLRRQSLVASHLYTPSKIYY